MQDARVLDSGGLYVIHLSDHHYYGGRAKKFSIRWRQHLVALENGRHSNHRMQNVFNKYRRFEPEVLMKLPPEDQIEAEQEWLNEHYDKSGCVNICSDARGGNVVEWTAEMRRRHSEIHLGLRHTSESRNKMSRTRRSDPVLVEKSCASLDINRINITSDAIARRARKTAVKLKGRKQTPEHIEKKAKAHRGRRNTPETLQKMSESARRRASEVPTSHSPDTRALISQQQKGRIWIHNSKRNRRMFPEDASVFLEQGWERGRISLR